MTVSRPTLCGNRQTSPARLVECEGIRCVAVQSEDLISYIYLKFDIEEQVLLLLSLSLLSWRLPGYMYISPLCTDRKTFYGWRLIVAELSYFRVNYENEIVESVHVWTHTNHAHTQTDTHPHTHTHRDTDTLVILSDVGCWRPVLAWFVLCSNKLLY